MNLEQFLLICLIEECAEVAQRATKALRFGTKEVQPGQYLDNFQRLSDELNDLLTVMDLMIEHDKTDAIRIDQAAQNAKAIKLLRFAAYSVQQGTLDLAALSSLGDLIERPRK